MAALVETLPQLCPLFTVDTAQFARTWGTQPGCRRCDQPHLATQHRSRRGCLAPCRATLVIALGAEQLFEVVVSARQTRHAVAVEQPGTVAAGNLGEVVDGRRQRARPVAVPTHGCDQSIKAASNRGSVLIFVVAEHMRCAMHPGVGALHIRPERCRALQPATNQLAQARKRRRTAPFCVTRSRLSATFSSRALSFRPGAASGERPSSVMALRTAAQ